MAGMLSRRKTKALVSARLAALGHSEDFISHDALDALRARAGHEAGAFAAALGAVLFLAATEDAPRIEGRHVEQAVPMHEAPVAAAEGPKRGWHILAASIGGAAGGALLALWVVHRPLAVPARIPTAVPAPHQLAPPPVVLALPKHRLAAPPPTVAAPAPKVDLPVAPPLRVSLLGPAGDRETASHLAALAARLRAAGIADVRLDSFNSRKIDARPWRHHVVYYFAQDWPLAKTLAAALESAEDSSPVREPWQPVLVSAAAGSTSHPPGSIDVFAP